MNAAFADVMKDIVEHSANAATLDVQKTLMEKLAEVKFFKVSLELLNPWVATQKWVAV